MGKISGKANIKTAKLVKWQCRLTESDNAYYNEREKMKQREKLYSGANSLRPIVPGDTERDGSNKKAQHVRNIIFENIESQISSSIPQPKVTPRRKKDERLAEIIEVYLRNELDRLPFETINDMAERVSPMQGGVAFLVEWDNEKRTHTTVGELAVSMVHPIQLAPQPGVYTSIHDMDWVIVKVPTTKEAVRRKYGVNVESEGESEPEVRSADSVEASDSAVTQYVGYEKNDDGAINLYSWVNDVELEDLENYQARRVDGEILDAEPLGIPSDMAAILNTMPGLPLGMAMPAGISGLPTGIPAPGDISGLPVGPMGDLAGVPLPGLMPGLMPGSMQKQIPYYMPSVYPIVLQRSVSVYGKLFGNSDVDVIADQQNTVNRIEKKIIDRLLKAGTRISLPDRADMRLDPEDGERWYIKPDEKQLIDVYNFSGDISAEMAYLQNVYDEARQVIGVTDSFQGRRDPTATSGKAKEFAAAQTAGRLESKRIMKDAAYADLFELMFKFALAYSDEPRTIVTNNSRGEKEYLTFDRHEFLEIDENGEYYWNDQFLFSTDTSAPLASNREAMWQETRMNLQTGAFGDPTQTETLILFWSKMEELHYPGASSTKSFLEEKMEREQMAAQQAQQQMMAQQMMSAQGRQPAPQGMGPGPPMGQGAMPGELPDSGYTDAELNLPPQLMMAIDRQAQAAAMKDAGMR